LHVVASQLNRIERTTLIRAPRSRVWSALTGVREFCQWFRAETAAPDFQPGARVRLISTHPGPCEKAEFFVDIVEMVPEQRFSWRWHPGAPVPGEDLSDEPMTLVEFVLEDAEGGTRVTVTESGFDRIFANRQSRVFKENEGGWQYQMAALERYLSEPA
jgi:uncharacterized protein YndB with AHSA1/START domain